MLERTFAIGKTQSDLRRVGDYEFQGDWPCFKVSYNFDPELLVNVIDMIPEHTEFNPREDYGLSYKIRCDGKYFVTSGHWITCTTDPNKASIYKQESIYGENDDLYHLRDINCGKLLYMNEEGWFNVDKRGEPVLPWWVNYEEVLQKRRGHMAAGAFMQHRFM